VTPPIAGTHDDLVDRWTRPHHLAPVPDADEVLPDLCVVRLDRVRVTLPRSRGRRDPPKPSNQCNDDERQPARGDICLGGRTESRGASDWSRDHRGRPSSNGSRTSGSPFRTVCGG
jgi:hypothetical protein